MDEEELNEALKSLVLKGLVDVEYDENLEARFKITPLGEAAVKFSQD